MYTGIYGNSLYIYCKESMVPRPLALFMFFCNFWCIFTRLSCGLGGLFIFSFRFSLA